MAEGGEDRPRGEVTEEEERLFHAMHLMGIKPRVEDAEDMMRLLKAFGKVKEDPDDPDKMASVTKPGSHHFPKLSSFYGEEGKGEASWATFKYEVEALVANKQYTEEQILFGIRRGLKGQAADKLRRLGTEVTVKDILTKLETDYGTVESKEDIMRKFYSCLQKPDETIEQYSSRLEDQFDKAVKLGALQRTDLNLLKEVFHAGLKKEIKLMTIYQKNTSVSYDELKRELRKLENDMKVEESQDTKKPCKPAVQTDSKGNKDKRTESSSEFSELKEMLKQINKRIDDLEKGKKEGENKVGNNEWYKPSFNNRGRGFRGSGRGRGSYRPRRPVGSQTFQPRYPAPVDQTCQNFQTYEPTCYYCNEKGHIQRNCPQMQQQYRTYQTYEPTCYLCNEKGHIQKNCPKIQQQFVCTKCKQQGHQSRECPN